MKTNLVLFTFGKLSSNFTRICADPDLHSYKMLDPGPYSDPHTINADPKHRNNVS
jgi:hypothetical protein